MMRSALRQPPASLVTTVALVAAMLAYPGVVRSDDEGCPYRKLHPAVKQWFSQ